MFCLWFCLHRVANKSILFVRVLNSGYLNSITIQYSYCGGYNNSMRLSSIQLLKHSFWYIWAVSPGVGFNTRAGVRSGLNDYSSFTRSSTWSGEEVPGFHSVVFVINKTFSTEWNSLDLYHLALCRMKISQVNGSRLGLRILVLLPMHVI